MHNATDNSLETNQNHAMPTFQAEQTEQNKSSTGRALTLVILFVLTAKLITYILLYLQLIQ